MCRQVRRTPRLPTSPRACPAGRRLFVEALCMYIYGHTHTQGARSGGQHSHTQRLTHTHTTRGEGVCLNIHTHTLHTKILTHTMHRCAREDMRRPRHKGRTKKRDFAGHPVYNDPVAHRHRRPHRRACHEKAADPRCNFPEKFPRKLGQEKQIFLNIFFDDPTPRG